jgi:negative regulator of flagellin synthesis FlgM
MKIESSNSQFTAPDTGAQRGTGNTDAKGATASVRPADATDVQNSTVTLSSISALRPSSDSDIDTAKVESIKAALRDGSYKIDAGNIADGMLSTASELLQTVTR